MELKIETKELKPFAILALQGWFAQTEVYKLKQECHRLVEDLGIAFLIIDLTQVTFIDSSGVGVLVHIDKACKVLRGQVTIVQPKNQMVLDTLHAVALQRFIDFHPTVAAALGATCAKHNVAPPNLITSPPAPSAGMSEQQVAALEERVRRLEERLIRIEAQLHHHAG